MNRRGPTRSKNKITYYKSCAAALYPCRIKYAFTFSIHPVSAEAWSRAPGRLVSVPAGLRTVFQNRDPGCALNWWAETNMATSSRKEDTGRGQTAKSKYTTPGRSAHTNDSGVTPEKTKKTQNVRLRVDLRVRSHSALELGTVAIYMALTVFMK